MNKIKRMLIGVMAVISLSTLLIGCNPASTTTAQASESTKFIGVEKAGSTALTHANLKEADAEMKKVQLVEADNKYIVVFTSDDDTYNYEINATTGEILGYYQSDEQAPDPVEPQESTTAGSQSPAVSEENAEGNITVEKAKEIALNHAGLVEKDVIFIKAKLDYDDGKQEYEIEFYSDNFEYDYDIDAKTGKITGYDKEIDDFSIPVSNPTTTTGGITVEEAKKIALAKVPGATDSNIRIKSDYDDGVSVYEGEIIYDNMEYDFEILASDGTVTQWETESVHG